jgi:hypothetical protein
MRHAVIIVLIAFASLARAQQASPQETEVLTVVAKCLLVGLPKDWYEAHVIVTLDEPGAASGEGRYLYAPQLARAQMVPFTPCTNDNPAKALVQLRAFQEPGRRGWNVARFVLHRDGKFDLTYDYPAKE